MNAPLSLVSVKITSATRPFGDARGLMPVFWRGGGVPEVSRDNAIGDQLLDMADALVTRTFELFECQPERR